MREVLEYLKGEKATTEWFLADYDWKEIFENFVNPVQNGDNPIHEPLDMPKITREDVAEIISISNGVNDEDYWLGIFKLKNGLYLMVRAWCDYSGWG